MKRKNTARSALFTSIISLLLCVTMLVGATFAWFTDKVESGINTIAAGNLDVELYHSDKNDSGYVGTATKLFNDVALWEPGAVVYENFVVENKGNLAMKYQLSINFENETVVDGHGLSEVLKVAVVEGGFTGDREDAKKLDLVPMKSFVLPGVLEGNTTSKTYGIVIYWQPTANDNLFNMNNDNQGKTLTIDLGVNLLATQEMYEDDSFGEDYDEDAIYFDALVNTDAELLAAIQDPEVAVIAIDTDVTYDWGGDSYENSKALLMAGKTFFGVDGDETITFAGYGSANPIVNVTLKDLTVKDATVGDDESAWEHGYLEFAGLYAENVVFEDSIMLVENPANATTYSLRSAAADKTTVSTLINCSFNNQIPSWYALWIDGGEATIRDCSFTGTRAIKVHEAYGSEVGSVVIVNNEFVCLSQKPGVVIGDVNAATSIALSDNLFAGTQPGDQNNYMYETDTVVTSFTFKEENNTVYTNAPSSSEELKNALTAGDDTVYLPAGSYTFPGSALSKGDVIICDEDAVFEGTSKLNINGATVIGATFSNPSGTAADQTINGTFKNCTFIGKNGLRWCYAGDTVVFENCVFDGSVYGVHFDGGANEVIFKDCTISGFNAMGGAITMLKMEGCTFKPGRSGYNGINLWGSVEMTDCTFLFDGSKTEWIDLCGSNTTASFTNCVVTNGVTEKDIKTVIGNYGAGNTVTVDGEAVVFSAEELTAAVAAGETVIYLRNGSYDLKGNQKDGLTLIGIGSNVKMANSTNFASAGKLGGIVKAIRLENVTVTDTVYTMAEGGSAVFTDVNFAAGFRKAYGTNIVFNGCSFGSNSEGYALHFESDGTSTNAIQLNDCVFEGGKVHLGRGRTYVFSGCDFAAGTDFQVWGDITLENCTVNGEKVTAENMATLFPDLNAAKVTLK